MADRLLHEEVHHMWHSLSAGSFAVVLVVAAAGCAAAVEQGTPPVPPEREMPMNPTLASVTEAVLADAVQRTGVDRGSLQVESAQAVTWADGSLGCPQPGMNYTMALVPGYRFKVRAGGQVLDYHASQRGYFVLCPGARSEEPVAVPETR
jgi:hypothetical protein